LSAPAYRREPHAFHGAVELRTLASELLRGNRAGDPHVREVPVYLPPQALADPGMRLPSVWILAGFGGRGQKYLETHPWHTGLVALYDRAVAAGELEPAILVLPDCFTRYGGSQYVDSAWLGPYERHLVEELVPYVDEHYPTRRGRRAVIGKSSGGFGALRLGMRHAELFGAVASISGDCCFEYSLRPDLLVCLRGLVPYGGDPARFLAEFFRAPDLTGDNHAVINVLAMAAAYSPAPASALGFELPFDLATGELVPAVWERWLAFDPLHAVEHHVAALKSLDLLHLECGLRDEFHLQWGLRRLVRKLAEHGVPFSHEEHDGGHFGLDARYLPLLGRMTASLAAR
jgi:enterochelin esterase family protein